jgi:hypothetical protein
MASRFTDTELWNEDWFLEMKGEYQLFAKYVFDKCDNAGVWKPNKIDFETKTKFKVSLDSLFEKMNGGQQRVLLLDNGRWFFTGYILFQWFNKKKTFDLVLSNRLHKSLHDTLVENKIEFKKVRGLREVLKTSMVMDMVKTEKEGLEGKTETPTQKIPWNMKPGEPEMSLELPEINRGSVVQLFAITKHQQVADAQVLGLWKIFKIQNFTGQKFYQSAKEVYSHFLNWCKSQQVPKVTEAAAIVANHKEKKSKQIQEQIYGKE